MLDNDDLNFDVDSSPEESNNRTFIIAASILGGIVLLSLICLAVYALLILPNQQANRAAQQTLTVAQNATVESALTMTAVAANFTMTPLPSPIATETPAASPTPVVAMPTDTPEPTVDPVTATVAAAYTQAAAAQLTVIPTSTLLPDTGFIDDVGLPGLLILSVVLLVVIFLARRLRTGPAAA